MQTPESHPGQHVNDALPTCVWIHGWGSDRTIWLPLMSALPGPHITLELPGFGEAHGIGPSALNDWLTDTAAQLPPNCILVGWSLGGMLATALATQAKNRVCGLVTMATNLCFTRRKDWPWAMAPAQFQRFCAEFDEQPLATWRRFCALQSQGHTEPKRLIRRLQQYPSPTAQTTTAWAAALAWLAELDNRDALTEYAGPALHLFGQGDALVPVAAADAVGRSGGEVQTLANTGHCLPLESRVITCLSDWLNRLRGPEAGDPKGRQPALAIDKSAIAASFGRASVTYDAAAGAQVAAGERLLRWLPGLQSQHRVLDVGCGTGFFTRYLRDRECGAARVTHLDLAEAMVRYAREHLAEDSHGVEWVCADGEHLPFVDGVFDGLFSNLALQWCPSLTTFAGEAERVLKPGGWCLISTLGPRTLHELKSAWRQLDGYTHVNEFLDPQQVKAEVLSGGLQLMRFERKPLVRHYRGLTPILKALKAVGAHNMNAGRHPGLYGRSEWRRLEQAYGQWVEDPEQWPVTYDLITLLLHKPEA